jgi:maltose operon periplasmic protein
MQRRISTHIIARITLGTLCCIFLSACAAPLETVMSRYQEASISCAGYREFGYEKLDIPDSKSFWIDKDSKVFGFDTGKSYFKAFELPKYSSPYSILIKSYQMGGSPAYIFSPAIMFLDERFAVTRFIEKGIFNYTRISLLETSSWETGWAFALEAKIPITPENANDRYMVILTTDDLINGKEVFVSPSFAPLILPGVVGAIPTGQVNASNIPHSPIGKIKVVVKSLGQ